MRWLMLVGLLLLNTTVLANGLSARVDRMQLGLGEQVQLTLSLSGVRGQRPDVSDLQKDFRIDQQSQSSNVQIINGVVSQEASWIFLLSPNRKGKLTIPAFSVAHFTSDPIAITVTDMPVAQSTSDDVLMEVEVSSKTPYVDSQVAYIQRLYFSRPLVDSASISRPKVTEGDADIQFWGSSEPRYVTHNNRPYQLIERYYLIYPKKAGTLAFEPSVFNGSLASSKQRNSFQMNRFRTGTRVSAYSQKISLAVKAKPADYGAEHWLPASQMTLSMNLSQPAERLKAGEPLTVTIALMARGLKAEVLPEVVLDLPAGIKSYPEKPTFRTDKITNGMVGLRQEKVVLIANAAGEYTIPEVR
ncbi:MAG: BatD family protein, partial [Leucothrix sp.]